MSQVRFKSEKTCIGCGAVFHPRNELDHRWRDIRYCSSTCQRRSGSKPGGQSVRRLQFPQGLARIDDNR